MGASDSKLVFKKGIFRLSEQRNILPTDPYWSSFWELPETTEDVFSLFSAVDIRRIRDHALENLETLILAVTSRLFVLRNHPSFPEPDFAPEKDALNCIRILTRLLPYLYESDQLQEWEEQFFWGTRRRRTRAASLKPDVLFDETDDSETISRDFPDDFEEVKPLAEELIDTLIDLLFFAEFTLPRNVAAKTRVTYAIWQSGVGCNTPVGTSKEFENNRCEILRLLLTLTSKSMYMSASLLPIQGVKAITYMATCSDKQLVLSVLCSLLNTTLKYNPAAWRVPYNHMVFKDPKQIFVTYALQLLLVVLLYPIPETGPAQLQKNYYRHFLGRLHRPQDFQFIVDGMTRILNQPILANASYLPGSQAEMKCSSEIIMLFWEITQCNRRFRSFIVDTDRCHDFVILLLFYATEHKLDTSKQGVVRMCIFLLQTLSVETNFGTSLNKKFDSQETLPACIQISEFRGTYGDHLIQSIYNLMTTSQGKLATVYPALLAIINNIAAFVKNLSSTTSAKLLRLFSTLSSPSFLLANASNHELLRSSLESLNAIIEHQYRYNARLVYAIFGEREHFEALRSFTLESGQAEIERQHRQRKDSEHDNADSLDTVSRRTSVDSVRSPSGSHMQTLGDVPEEGTFTIGDDDDEDEDTDNEQLSVIERATSSDRSSRRASTSSNVDDAVPVQLRGMSEKARGKMPASTQPFSRHGSMSSLSSPTAMSGSVNNIFSPTPDWIGTWLPDLPLHTILTLLPQLSNLLQEGNMNNRADLAFMLKTIQDTEPRGIDTSAIRIHAFEWSPLSLGWYESLLWSFVFTSEMQISKGTVGVWNGTAIKLFRVQEIAAEGPTLSSPRGAVDAVGSNIVSRIGSISLRGQGAPTTQQGSGGGGQSPMSGRPIVRSTAI